MKPFDDCKVKIGSEEEFKKVESKLKELGYDKLTPSGNRYCSMGIVITSYNEFWRISDLYYNDCPHDDKKEISVDDILNYGEEVSREIVLDMRIRCGAIRIKHLMKNEPNGLHPDYESVLFYQNFNENTEKDAERIFEIKLKQFQKLGFIYEEPKKTLWDKRLNVTETCDNCGTYVTFEGVSSENIKKALNEIKRRFEMYLSSEDKHLAKQHISEVCGEQFFTKEEE